MPPRPPEKEIASVRSRILEIRAAGAITPLQVQSFDHARGVSQLIVDAVAETSRVVEAMHATIAAVPRPFGPVTDVAARGPAALVYGSVRWINRMIGASLDNAWRLAASFAGVAQDESRWSAALSALNGVVGDHLAKSGNPLAIAMHLRCEGWPLALDDGSPLVLPGAGAKVALLIHGLCMSELQWTRRGHDHGKLMRQTLGYTPVYLRYNSGRSVFENGRELAGLLEQLLERWPLPIEELVILAHSMGGLVARSAVHQAAAAGRRWPSRLRKLVFLGTPHHGAPLERGGNWLQHVIENSPYTAPLARLGKLRSSGVTDLRFGNVVAEDLADADRFAHAGDRRRPIPLPREVACFAVAGALGRHERALGTRLLGDGLVPIDSALGRHAEPERSLDFPDSQRWIAYGCNHWDLLDRPEVAEQLCQWLGGAREP